MATRAAKSPTSAKAHDEGETLSRSAEALLPPHECGGFHQLRLGSHADSKAQFFLSHLRPDLKSGLDTKHDSRDPSKSRAFAQIWFYS
jgi:hypothetical protein